MKLERLNSGETKFRPGQLVRDAYGCVFRIVGIETKTWRRFMLTVYRMRAALRDGRPQVFSEEFTMGHCFIDADCEIFTLEKDVGTNCQNCQNPQKGGSYVP